MFRDVVLEDTKPQEWPAIRERIHARLMASMGTPPELHNKVDYEVIEEYENYGLTHRKIRYRLLPDEPGLAVIVLPKDASKSRPAPAVIICHGTYGGKLGKNGPLTLEPPECGYAIELAQRGFVTVVPDNYKFGERLLAGLDEKVSEDELNKRYTETLTRFNQDNPDWSLDGLRLWEHKRLLDILDETDFVRPGAYGVMGNSLGGRMTVFLAALDERIAAAVPSCGISPNLTNVYRTLTGHASFLSSPKLNDYFRKSHGHLMYEYQDMIALCAPRALLVLDPYNDSGNPYIQANFDIYVAGQHVYQLLSKSECFTNLTHGDGHATLEDVRDFAYRWLERWLMS